MALPIRQRFLLPAASARLGAFLLGLRRAELMGSAPALDLAVLEETLDQLGGSGVQPPMKLVVAHGACPLINDELTAIVKLKIPSAPSREEFVFFEDAPSSDEEPSTENIICNGAIPVRKYLLKLTNKKHLAGYTLVRIGRSAFDDLGQYQLGSIELCEVMVHGDCFWLVELDEILTVTQVDDDLEPIIDTTGKIYRKWSPLDYKGPGRFVPTIMVSPRHNLQSLHCHAQIFPVHD